MLPRAGAENLNLKDDTKEVSKTRPAYEVPVKEFGLFPESYKPLSSGMIESNFSFRNYTLMTV